MKKILYVSVFLFLVLIPVIAKDIKKEEKIVWPLPPDEPRIEYVSSIRSADDFGIEKGFFSKVYDFIFGDEDPLITAPFGLYADDKRVYVTDISSQTVNIFDKKDNDFITINGTDDELFLYPIDVVSDKKGKIYVSDSVRAKIYVFEPDGDHSFTIELKEFKRPIGVAINEGLGRLYIADALADAIHVTSLDGKYIKSIGKRGSANGEFNRPTFLDIANDGKIYLSDSMNHRVQILDKDGNYLNSFGGLGQRIGSFANPRGIAIDSDENVYVSDTVFNTVQIFNKYGEVLMKFGSYGNNKGEFALPEDITILPDNTIFIADTNNKCFKIFKRLDQNQERGAK